MDEDLRHAVDTLRRLRQEHLDKAERLAEAIATLMGENAGRDKPRVATPRSTGPSVYQLVRDLLNEAPREWTAREVIEELDRRGHVLDVKVPENAVFTALSKFTRNGEFTRIGHGRYVAAKHLRDLQDTAEAPIGA